MPCTDPLLGEPAPLSRVGQGWVKAATVEMHKACYNHNKLVQGISPPLKGVGGMYASTLKI